MYRGFNLSNVEFRDNNFERYLFIGEKHLDHNEREVKKILNKFILENGVLDGNQMQSNWFPMIEADIFISHSHANKNLAIALAGWLYDSMHITSFIDSSVWGYAYDLLWIIDNEYCIRDDQSYSYELRNISTSHVHAMLSSALTMMIDKTECLFFLNTPDSIKPSQIKNDDKTFSPWLYSEISISQLIRKKKKETHRPAERVQNFSKGLNENSMFEYRVDLNHLTRINGDDLALWRRKYTNEKYPLDVLYNLNPLLDDLIKSTIKM
jgi:hypothetical protein